MSNALETKRSAAEMIDTIAAGAMDMFKSTGSIADELALAQAIGDMRLALTPELMAPIMNLMNTDLGFRADAPNEKRGPYTVTEVRECFIESKLRGFRSVGNEWNIISGRFYAAKNGLRRKVTTWPGLTGFRDGYEIPRLMGDRGAVVKCKASWRLDGTEDAIEAEIPVKVNAGMGADAILGKAERKLLKRIHDRLCGWSTPDGEVGEEDMALKNGGPVPDQVSQVKQALADRKEELRQ